MARHWLAKGLTFVLLAALCLALAGWVVASLWNWLMPGLFGLPAIGFAQALGLLVLSRLLFGGWRGGGGGRRWRHGLRERFERMTPEERQRFREGLAGRCGHSLKPDAQTPA